MLGISESIRQYYLPDLYYVSYPRPKVGINSWLSSGKDYFVKQTSPSGEFSVSTFQATDFLSSYVFDINRLSCAAFESVCGIGSITTDDKSFGWDLVKLYYASFFSAHTILRIANRGLSNIETTSISKAQQIALGYSQNFFGVSSGVYCIELDTIKNDVKFVKKNHYSDSHKGLWLKFLHFMEEILADRGATSITNYVPSDVAQDTISKIEELKEAICNHGLMGSWLSKMRNNINYSQGHGTWYPYKELEAEKLALFGQAEFYNKNPLEIAIRQEKRKEIVYFIKTCQFIVCLCHDMLTDIANRNQKNNSFVKDGLLKYLNHLSRKTTQP